MVFGPLAVSGADPRWSASAGDARTDVTRARTSVGDVRAAVGSRRCRRALGSVPCSSTRSGFRCPWRPDGETSCRARTIRVFSPKSPAIASPGPRAVRSRWAVVVSEQYRMTRTTSQAGEAPRNLDLFSSFKLDAGRQCNEARNEGLGCLLAACEIMAFGTVLLCEPVSAHVVQQADLIRTPRVCLGESDQVRRGPAVPLSVALRTVAYLCQSS